MNRGLTALPRSVRICIMVLASMASAAAWLVLASWVFVLGTGLISHYPRPMTEWLLYLPYRNENHRVHWWLIASAIIATAAVGIMLGRLVYELFWRDRFASDDLYGETKWATPQQMRGAGFSLSRRPRA